MKGEIGFITSLKESSPNKIREEGGEGTGEKQAISLCLQRHSRVAAKETDMACGGLCLLEGETYIT